MNLFSYFLGAYTLHCYQHILLTPLSVYPSLLSAYTPRSYQHMPGSTYPLAAVLHLAQYLKAGLFRTKCQPAWLYFTFIVPEAQDHRGSNRRIVAAIRKFKKLKSSLRFRCQVKKIKEVFSENQYFSEVVLKL